jgi:hypothetical protein
MAEAAYATGPALLGPRTLVLFSNLLSVSARGRQTNIMLSRYILPGLLLALKFKYLIYYI